MSNSFRALRLNKTDDGQSHEFVEMTEDELMASILADAH